MPRIHAALTEIITKGIPLCVAQCILNIGACVCMPFCMCCKYLFQFQWPSEENLSGTVLVVLKVAECYSLRINSHTTVHCKNIWVTSTIFWSSQLHACCVHDTLQTSREFD